MCSLYKFIHYNNRKSPAVDNALQAGWQHFYLATALLTEPVRVLGLFGRQSYFVILFTRSSPWSEFRQF